MLVLLSHIATLLSLLLVIPAFITAIGVLRAFSLSSIRFSKYFKMLLLQAFIYSLFFVAALFYKEFETPFLVHSFCMLPIGSLLLLRLFHLKWQKQQHVKLQRAITKVQQPPTGKRKPDLRRWRLRAKSKSQWH